MDSESVLETGTSIVPIGGMSGRLTLVCGLPSAITYFVADLVRDMLARTYGSCEVISLNEMSATTREKLAEAKGGVVGLAEVPDDAVANFARDGGFPNICVAQPFSNACRDFMALREAGLVDTIRVIARSHVGIGPIAEVPGTVMLTLDPNEPASAWVERISTAIGLDPAVKTAVIGEGDIDRPLSQVVDEKFPLEKVPLGRKDQETLHRLDAFYGVHFEHASEQLKVPMDSLLEAAAPHLQATNAIPLMGPARCLTFGPYMYLPLGRWQARFTFDLIDNASTNRIGFDIATDQEIKVDRSFDMSASGTFAFNCEFDVTDQYTPVEFRTYLRQGAIEGQFTPQSLLFERGEV